MGSLTLPASGLVYADTQILIYTIENHPDYAPLLMPLWLAVQAQTFQVISSELVMLETLVVPIRRNDSQLIADYEYLFQFIRLIPIHQQILREAARLRATVKGLRTPDAIHAATSMQLGCSLFLSNDKTLSRISELPILILEDVISF
jgi:predicted nucleic acid-binding protein